MGKLAQNFNQKEPTKQELEMELQDLLEMKKAMDRLEKGASTTDKAKAFMAGVGGTASLGLAYPAAGLLRTVTEPKSVIDERSFPRRVLENTEAVKAEASRDKAIAPAYGLAGDIAGFSTGLPKLAYKGLTNLASRGVAQLPKTLLGMELAPLKYLGSGAGAVATGQATTTLPYSDLESRKRTGALELGLGTLAGMTPDVLKVGLTKVEQGIKSGKIPAFVRNLIPGGKAMYETEKFNRESAFNAAKTGAKLDAQSAVASIEPEVSKIGSATSLQETVKATENSMRGLLGKASGVIKEFGDAKVSVEPVRQKIASYLDRFGMLDAKGNIIPDSMNSVLTSEQKAIQKYLVNLSETLKSNPSIYNLDRIRKVLQESANFNSLNRTPIEKMYGGLSHDVREAMMDGLESVTKGTSKASLVSNIRGEYSKVAGVLKELGKITDQYPEQIAGRVANQMPGTFIQEAISKVPAVKQPIKDMVLNDLVSKAKSPEAFTKAIDKYGRETLSQLLDKKTYNQLLKVEDQMFKAWQLKGTKFVMPLGKFWTSMQSLADKGIKIPNDKASAFFVAVSNALNKQEE